MPRKWMEKAADEDRCCDGRTSLRYVWIEWEKYVEQQQTYMKLDTVDRGRSERKVRKEKRKKNHDGNGYSGQPHP